MDEINPTVTVTSTVDLPLTTDGNRKDRTEGMNRKQRRRHEAEERHEAGKAKARANHKHKGGR